MEIVELDIWEGSEFKDKDELLNCEIKTVNI